MSERLGLGFLGFPDVKTLAQWGRRAETAGFESVWVAETRISRDAVTGMTALLLSTDRIRVGSAAINAFTRGVALTAVTWASMAEAFPGRVVLGIGPGSPAPLAQQGYSFDRPLSRLCEFTQTVQAVWEQPAPVDFHGEFTTLNGLIPEVVPEIKPPIYFCVTGPRALEAAGRESDGIVFNAFMPPAYVERARTLLDRGAGSHFEGEIGGALVVTVADTLVEAAARVRPILATYCRSSPTSPEKRASTPPSSPRCRLLPGIEVLRRPSECCPTNSSRGIVCAAPSTTARSASLNIVQRASSCRFSSPTRIASVSLLTSSSNPDAV